MYFCRSCLTEKTYDSRRGCSANDGVVNQNHSLAAHNFGYYIQLYLNEVFSELLTGSYKRASDVFVLDKSDFIRNARLMSVS